MEKTGVIEGYYPKLNYEAARLPLQLLFVGTAATEDRANRVDQLLDIRGVVDVRETLTGKRNLFVEVVAEDTTDVVRISDAIHDLGLSVESSEILRQRRVQPFDHFQFEPPTDDEHAE